MNKAWGTPAAIVLAGTLIATAIHVRPIIGEQEIKLSQHELIRVDAASGISKACTKNDTGERCVTLSDGDGRFLPYVTQEMRAVGVRDTLRAKLRGE